MVAGGGSRSCSLRWQQWAVLDGGAGSGSGLTIADSAQQLVDQYHPHEPHRGHDL